MAESGPQKKVLVVDDEPGVLSVLASILEREGYEVLSARNADEALSLFDGPGAGVVLSDVRMPGRDGVSLLSQLRERDPELPVILMTGFGTIDAAVEAMRLGATDYVTKPFKRERILDALRRVSDRSKRDGAVRMDERVLAEALDECLTVREITDLYIDRVLELNGGNKVQAARMLGINRRTIYRRGEKRREDDGEALV